MHTEIKPGAYRALFIDALKHYRLQASAKEYPCIDHYTALLRDPKIRLGEVQHDTPAAPSGSFSPK